MTQYSDKTIIIRPSGVWDTRSPLIKFNQNNHYINQIYYSSILSFTKVQVECSDFDENTLASTFFCHRKKSNLARNVWSAFKKSFPSDIKGNRNPPIISDVQRISYLSVHAVTEYALIKYGALFESYAQCWALNYLLSRLENGFLLTKKESDLVQMFSPRNKRNNFIPGWRHIYKSIPIIYDLLSDEPHIKTNPFTKKEVNEPINSKTNAFTVINLWRDWRNSIVHQSGMINERFYNKNKQVWTDMQKLFPKNIELLKGERLPCDHTTFRAVTTVHSRAAKAMRDLLVKTSNERRGHVHAPGKAWNYKQGLMPPEKIPDKLPPMLMKGDHNSSFLWATDNSYRRKVSKFYY